jgi:hypothetical protein
MGRSVVRGPSLAGADVRRRHRAFRDDRSRDRLSTALGLPGAAQVLSARVVDELGSELARESIELGFDPCTNSTAGASGAVITHAWDGLAY